ncbi:hypothetical protein [Pedobacter antarcticus]|uniref:hypothetical protein n=1 Tax=Pedobacter antarcticus TaxID=34086 RepID=UPI001C5955E8|nr:hypothetical protein [Pedobacter antarcticus]
MLKKLLLLNLAAVSTTFIEVLWAAPDGPSGVDMNQSPLSYIEYLCLYSVVIISSVFYFAENNKITKRMESLIYSGALTIYWYAVNYVEFETRVASWSTYSTVETWMHVTLISTVPISCCIVLFLISVYFIQHTKQTIQMEYD